MRRFPTLLVPGLLLVLLGLFGPQSAAAKRVLVDDGLLDAPTHQALLAAFDAHSAANPGTDKGQLPIPSHLAARVMEALNAGADAAAEAGEARRALKDVAADGTVLMPYARALGAVAEHHDNAMHREADGTINSKRAEGWSGLLYLEGDGLLVFKDVLTGQEQGFEVKPGRFFAWKNDRHTHRLEPGAQTRKMLGPLNADGERFYQVGATETTAICPLLNGLKCNSPALVPFGANVINPCGVDADGVTATGPCDGRRQLGLDPLPSGVCALGTTYVQVSDTDANYCGVGPTCLQWVQAPKWVCGRVGSNPCPVVPASDSPIAITATTKETSYCQGSLAKLTVRLARPANRRLLGEERRGLAFTGASWGNTKSKVPVNYALRLDLPSRVNMMVKHVSIFPSIKPWADSKPQVMGESLFWPRVPMGQSAKRKTKRTFNVLMRIRSAVNNLGPMAFTATVYRVDADGVVTDLQQAVVTITVTPPCKPLLGIK